MFILDSLFLAGFRWVLDTVRTAAEAEMNDEGALRDALLAAEMRREMGEISDDEFAAVEADLLTRIREIRERREGGAGPIAFGAALESEPGTTFQVDATVSGDFHESVEPPGPATAAQPSERVVAAPAPTRPRRPAAPRSVRPPRAVRKRRRS